MQIRRAPAIVITLGTLAGTLALGGCSAERSQLAGARINPTPELATLDARPDDRSNGAALLVSTNLRAMNEDISRMFFMNRPSRLAPEPIR
jgi:hypothetical protein